MSHAGTLDDHIREFRAALDRGDVVAAELAAKFAGIAWARMAEERGAGMDWPKAFENQPYRSWCEEGAEMFGRRQSGAGIPLNWTVRRGNTHAAHCVGRDE